MCSNIMNITQLIDYTSTYLNVPNLAFYNLREMNLHVLAKIDTL